MPNLFQITSKKEGYTEFSKSEEISVMYHDIFDFPLTISELIKWRAGDKILPASLNPQIITRNGYFFFEGKDGIVYKRTLRERISERKMGIAVKAAKILSFLPFIKMVAVTGSLAMKNSTDESDIDLMIVTGKGSLWTSRLISHLLMHISGFKIRKSGDRNQKDKLCMNIWLEESSLKWSKNRNIYTAHEIAQIIPLIDKNQTYNRFIGENRWVLKYWPNAVQIKDKKIIRHEDTGSRIPGFLEKMAFQIQYVHMRSKITREVITPTRALFHPQDWGEVIKSRFSS